MPALNTRRTYVDGSILFQSDLDAVVDDIETLLNVTKLNDDNIQDQGITASAKLLDASITSGKLASNSVITAKIADQNVTGPKLASTVAGIGLLQNVSGNLDVQLDGSSLQAIGNIVQVPTGGITTSKIAAQNVTTATIADQNVTAAKIADGNVITSKLAAQAVTADKLGPLNINAGSSSGALSVGASTWTAIGGSFTFTNSGRHSVVELISSGGGSTSSFNLSGGNGTVRFLRNGTPIGYCDITAPGVSPKCLDVPGAGTYTYQAQVLLSSGGNANYLSLIVYEP